MSANETKVVELTRSTGVSRDVINKLLSGKSASTSVENAVLISAYFGMSVEEFLKCGETGSQESLHQLIDLLSVEEQRLLLAQVRGLLSQR